MKVAVVGLGRMGAAMARRIAAESDHELFVFNRSKAKADTVAADTGATAVPTAAEAVSGCDVCLVSLADNAAVLDTYHGGSGILAGLTDGAVVCDTSTVEPATGRALAPAVEKRGASLLDTPVSGSVPSVESGKLAIMVGGSTAALEKARPVLDLISASVFHMGDVGTGATMKLVVNSMIAALNAGVSEAIVLAEKAGIDPAAAYDVLESSAVAAPFVSYKRAAFLDPANAPVAFSLALIGKDQELIHQLAVQVGARMDQADAARALVSAAIAADYGDHDMSALAAYLSRD